MQPRLLASKLDTAPSGRIPNIIERDDCNAWTIRPISGQKARLHPETGVVRRQLHQRHVLMCAVGHPLIIPSNTRVNFFTNSEKYTHYGPRLTAGSSLDRLR